MHRLIASWFGSGLILRRVRGSDIGSGTLAAGLTFGAGLLIAPLGWAIQTGAAVAVTLLSIWAAAPFSSHDGPPDPAGTKEGDPGWVVVDEAAGALVAMIGLGLPAAVVGWIIFRAADIFKTRFPGVASAERLGGGLGITADDIVAGLYGLAAGWLFQLLLG